MKPKTIQKELQEQTPETVHLEQEEALSYAEQLKQQEELEDKNITILSEIIKKISPNEYPEVLQIKGWKEAFGKVYMSTIVDDEDIYIWRPIYRQEWQELTSKYQSASANIRQQALLEKCLLFPSINTILYNRPAGFMSALESKIMFQSGFIDEGLLLQSIRIID